MKLYFQEYMFKYMIGWDRNGDNYKLDVLFLVANLFLKIYLCR